MEKWMQSRFENYLISDCGRVKNLTTGKISIGSTTNKGYQRITSTPKSVFIHSLVAEKFCPNPNNYLEVDHLDCDRSNNNASNLEWVSREINIQRSFENGNKSNKLTKNPMSKLSLKDMLEIQRRYTGRRGEEKASDLAVEFNVCLGTIMKVMKKEVII